MQDARPRTVIASARLALVGVRGWADAAHPTPHIAEQTKAQTPMAKEVTLPAPDGPRAAVAAALAPLDIYILPDDSGSMYGHYGDPMGVRYAAARSLVTMLSRYSTACRVSVVHWGSTAPVERALPLTSTRNKRRIRSYLTIPPTLGGNALPLALARCAELLDADPRRIPIVVVMTDGIETVGADTQAQIDRFPAGAVHVLLVDHSGGCNDTLVANWRRLGLGSFTRLRTGDTQAMARQLADVAAAAVGLEMPEDPPATTKEHTTP